MSFTEGLQFSRFIEVTVKNFKTGEKITIGNEFRIDFSFYKTIDEVNEASVGQVKIYGLSEETRKALGGSGGELTLRTGYLNSEIKTLFIADITSIAPEYTENQPIVVIDVSANFLDYKFSKTYIPDDDNTSILTEALSIANAMGKGFSFVVDVPSEYQEDVVEWISTRKIRSGSNYTVEVALEKLCSMFGLTHRTEVDEEGKELIFSIPQNQVPIIVSWATGSYDKIKTTTDQDELDKAKFTNVFITDEKEAVESAVVLSSLTGLISYPRLESKIVDVAESWKVAANEEATAESLNSVADKKKKIEDKKKEREAKGLKPLKSKPKNYRIKVVRKFITVKALLNPSVKPQSHVRIISKIEEANGVFRVRNARYVGTNRDGEYYMELNVEDSGGKYDRKPTEQEMSLTKNRSDYSANGDTVDYNNIGSDNEEYY